MKIYLSTHAFLILIPFFCCWLTLWLCQWRIMFYQTVVVVVLVLLCVAICVQLMTIHFEMEKKDNLVEYGGHTAATAVVVVMVVANKKYCHQNDTIPFSLCQLRMI